MNMVADRAPVRRLSDAARAAVEYRDIHLVSCRYRRQGLVCSTCSELVDRAARLEARPGCQVCGEPHGVSVPCGFRRDADAAR